MTTKPTTPSTTMGGYRPVLLTETEGVWTLVVTVATAGVNRRQGKGWKIYSLGSAVATTRVDRKIEKGSKKERRRCSHLF